MATIRSKFPPKVFSEMMMKWHSYFWHLAAYKEQLDEFADIREDRLAVSHAMILIVEKMSSLSDQLEGDAKQLIIEDIER